MMLEWIGLLGSLALLIVLTMRGVDLLLAAPVCALLLALSFGLPLFPQLAGAGADNFTSAYMTGFSGFLASWFFVFLLGSVFGKVMEDSGAADSVAQWVVQRFGARHALVAVIGACAVLTYGGVSLFVVAFSVFPLALALFREAGLPRRFIPGTIAFGSVTFTMTSAGSPEIQNWIPMQYLGTTPYAAWQVSLVVALLMAVTGFVWLKWMIGRSITAGERYDVREGDPQPKTGGLPHPATGLIPLAAVLGVAFALHDHLKQSALIVALLAGVLTVLVVNRNYFINLPHAVSNGTARRADCHCQHRSRRRVRRDREAVASFRCSGRFADLPTRRSTGQRLDRGHADRGPDRICVRRPGDCIADPRTALPRPGRGCECIASRSGNCLRRPRLAAAQRVRCNDDPRRVP